MSEPLRSISRIASDHGLRRDEVRVLIIEWHVPTYRFATASVVGPEGWAKLKPHVERYAASKAARDGRMATAV